jgi:hypothetical protein
MFADAKPLNDGVVDLDGEEVGVTPTELPINEASGQLLLRGGATAWPPLLCESLYAEAAAFGWFLSAFGFLASRFPFN